MNKTDPLSSRQSSMNSVMPKDLLHDGSYTEHLTRHIRRSKRVCENDEDDTTTARYLRQLQYFNHVDQTGNLHQPERHDSDDHNHARQTADMKSSEHSCASNTSVGSWTLSLPHYARCFHSSQHTSPPPATFWKTMTNFGQQQQQQQQKQDSLLPDLEHHSTRSFMFNREKLEDIHLEEDDPSTQASLPVSSTPSSLFSGDILVRNGGRKQISPLKYMKAVSPYTCGMILVLKVVSVFLAIYVVALLSPTPITERFQGGQVAADSGKTTAPVPTVPVVHIAVPSPERKNVIRIEALKHKLLQANIIEDASALNDIHSIPFYALRWLSDTDKLHMSVDDPQLFERYTLALLFYTAHTEFAKSHSNGEWWLSPNKSWDKEQQTSGPWAHWLAHDIDVCQWQGIACETKEADTDQKVIVGLNLTNKFLTSSSKYPSPSLPGELRALSHLTMLDLSHNELQGTIPDLASSKVGMTGLRILHLEHNRLTGTIPSSFQYLSSLRELYLNNNLLTGKLPVDENNEFQAVAGNQVELNASHNLRSSSHTARKHESSLEILQIHQNHLSGPLPELSACSRLKKLQLGSNSFTGTLPRAWGDVMTNLQTLIVNHNLLSGTIPKHYGSGLLNLQYLGLNGNHLDGSIPTQVGQLRRLEIMLLDNNDLTGTLPSEISQLDDLRTITVNSNSLTGEISNEICELETLSSSGYLSADCRTGDMSCSCCNECY